MDCENSDVYKLYSVLRNLDADELNKIEKIYLYDDYHTSIGWDWLYQFTSNYGLALILFAVIVQVVMVPMSYMSKKSSMKMARIQPKIQAIQRKYADDQQKQSQEIQDAVNAVKDKILKGEVKVDTAFDANFDYYGLMNAVKSGN